VTNHSQPTGKTGAPSPYVTSEAGQLVFQGKPFRLLGINAPQLATFYPVNGGCGAQIDPSAFFSTLSPHTAVAVGFQQDEAVNATTGARDWRSLDRVVSAAEASPSRPLLVISLANQGGVCDANVWKGRAWYAGGFRTEENDLDRLPRQSFWDYMRAVVDRYKDSPAIAMWEPVGEPEASDCLPGYVGPQCYGHDTCPPDASAVLRRFFDEVGAEIKSIDPNHLVGDGALGGTQCGWTGDGPQVIDQSPGIDVLTFHDYSGYAGALEPPELGARLELASGVGKPLVVGEVGLSAGSSPACTSKGVRARRMLDKLDADIVAGAAGFMVWAYGGPVSPEPRCDYYVMDDDPTMALLRANASAMWP
jgi:hypothetical protein